MDRDPEQIYRHERDGLLRFAYLLCGDRVAAEDAVAEAVARAWPELRRGRVDDPGAYLRRAVANRLLDTKRHLRVVQRVDRQRVWETPPSPDALATDRVLVAEVLGRLPAPQRAVVVCRFFSAMTVAETAATLAVSEGTVKSRMSRALDALKEMLIDDEGDASAVI